MTTKKWVKIFSAITLILIFGLYLINYKIDSYSIFKKNYSNIYREPNQNFIKMKFLLNNEHPFDSFIFGSSRVGKINPTKIKNGKYYNMTYSEGTPLEHFENIKLLIESGIEIKNILIGLDDFSYEVEPLKHLTQPMRLPHYSTAINHMNFFQFYTYYLSKKPSMFEIKQMIFNNSSQTTYGYDIYNTGQPIVPHDIENNIENNKYKHVNDIKFTKPDHYEGNRLNKTLSEIKEIINLLKTHNINFKFFINPIHKTTYLDTNFENIQTFKYELSKLTDYYDFSGLNSITTNNYYYYETSHYRPIVGDFISSKLFNTPGEAPVDFGVLVTKYNINQHLKKLEEEINIMYVEKTLTKPKRR